MPPAAATAPPAKKKRPGDEAKRAIEATRRKLKEPEVREERGRPADVASFSQRGRERKRGWREGRPKNIHPSKHQIPPHRLSQEVLKYVRKLADAVKKEPLVAR